MDQNLNIEAETLTKTLCGHLAAAQFGDLSAAAKHEARRGVLDWIGCALAGSGHKTIITLLAVLAEISGRPQATENCGLALPMRRWPTARWDTCSITTIRIWAASCCTPARRCSLRCLRSPSARP
jgi:hypothetical protein